RWASRCRTSPPPHSFWPQRRRGTSDSSSIWRRIRMTEFSPGLAGVVAFETEIAEPDREGGELRYRGVNIEDLVGKVPFEQVWGLLVDESLEPGLPAAYCELEHRTGGYMSDLQSALAALSGRWKLGQLIDIDDDQAKEDLRRLSAAALSIVAQSARGADKPPVPEETVVEGHTAAERFLLAWRGEVNEDHAKAIDTYWICTAEHEVNAKKNPDHSYTNVEFWSAIVLDVAEIPPQLAPAMFACSRTAGWSAHILEQKRLGVLVRPSAKYVGPGARSLQEV